MNKSKSIMMTLLVVLVISFYPTTSNAKSLSSSEILNAISHNTDCNGTNCMHVNMELTKEKLNRTCRLKQGLISNYRYLDYLTEKCYNEAIGSIMDIQKIKYEGGVYVRN